MKRLANNAGVMLEEPDDIYGEQSFSRDAIKRFGSLSNELVDHQPQLHLQMSVLATLTIEALETGNDELAKSILNFLDEVIGHVPISSEIPNAVAISFVLPAQIREAAGTENALAMVPERVLLILQSAEANERFENQNVA
jgi:hypothetical protein